MSGTVEQQPVEQTVRRSVDQMTVDQQAVDQQAIEQAVDRQLVRRSVGHQAGDQRVVVRRAGDEPSAEPCVEIELTVNGMPVVAAVTARMSLADFVRDHLGLTATHVGCEQGVCGSCTVLVNGASTRACLYLAAQASGTEVVTVEGLSPPAALNDIQAALVEAGGIQCGFCTPGFVVTLTEMVGSGRIAAMDDDALRRELDGNLCRCTGYVGVLDAARSLAERVRQATTPEEPR